MSDIKFSGTSDFSKVKKDYDDLARRAAKLEAENARLGKTSRKQAAGYKGARREMSGMLSVGRGVFSGLVAAAGSYLMVMKEINAANERASQSVSGLARGMGPLGQLAATNEERQRLRKQASQLFAMGATSQTGAGGMVEAGNMAFALESAGLLRERQMFGMMAASRLVRPEEISQLAVAVKTMADAMGTKEIGTPRQLLSKALVASGFNPASMPALLQSTARTGVNARALGYGDEEMLTATAMMASATGSPELGSTRVDALLRAMRTRGGFQGMSFSQGLAKIQGMGMSDPELQKYLGSSEAMGAFGVLTTQDFAGTLERVTKAQNTDIVSKRIRNNLRDVDIALDLKERQTTARRELQEIHEGRMEKLADAVTTEKVRLAEKRSGRFMGALMGIGGKIGDWAVPTDTLLRNINVKGLDPIYRTMIQDALADEEAVAATRKGGWGLGGWDTSGNTAQKAKEGAVADVLVSEMREMTRSVKQTALRSAANAARADVSFPIE